MTSVHVVRSHLYTCHVQWLPQQSGVSANAGSAAARLMHNASQQVQLLVHSKLFAAMSYAKHDNTIT